MNTIPSQRQTHREAVSVREYLLEFREPSSLLLLGSGILGLLGAVRRKLNGLFPFFAE
jgi:PEP-CTERM motif